MSNRHRIRTACLALIAGGVLFAAQASQAIPVEYHPDSVATVDGSSFGSTGFDNSSLMLTHDFDITNDWAMAGFPLAGEMFDVEIQETQTLRGFVAQPVGDPIFVQGLPNQELNVLGTWTSQVDWTVTNTTGQEGPALLFFSGLQEFALPGNPNVAGPEQYLPSEVQILTTGDFSVARYVAQSGTFFYLAFYIEDFSGPVNLSFEYQVTRDIIGLETDDFGTPILQMNAFFVPEPSASVMMVVGLIGLAYVGRSRGC